jgi:syntaxin 1B/2/3
MASQYGNGGYQQMGYGANPYDQRDGGAPDAQGARFNNYAQGRYDDRKWPCFSRRCSD